MAVSNGKITAPVNTDDVASALGYSNHDVGTLCSNSHGKINRWAKHKPVKHTDVDTLANTYKGSDRWCGFNPMTLELDLVDYYKKGNTWIYNPPVPGTDFCRLTDFDGYNHQAIPFMATHYAKGGVVNVSNASTVDAYAINIDITTSSSDSIVLSDVLNGEHGYDISTAKMCVRFYNANPLTSTYATVLGTHYSQPISQITNGKAMISVPFKNYAYSNSTRTIYGLFGFTVQTSSEQFLPIPWDDSNYFMVQYNLVSGTIGLTYLLKKIGSYYNNSPITTLQDVNNFIPASSSKPFKATSRMAFRCEYQISNTTGSPVTLSPAYENYTFVNNNSNVTISGEIIQVNGSSTIPSNVTVQNNGSATFVVDFYGDGEPFKLADFGTNVSINIRHPQGTSYLEIYVTQ